MGSIAILVALWAMVGQLYFLMGIDFSYPILKWIANNSHPLWVIYGASLIPVGLTVLGLAYLGYKSERFMVVMGAIFERISLLTGLYLFLDILGLIIVIIRNV